MKIKTNLKPRDYWAKEVVRIVDPKQMRLYTKHGVYPIDIYSGINHINGEDITVMVYLKEDTKEVFEKWRNFELD